MLKTESRNEANNTTHIQLQRIANFDSSDEFRCEEVVRDEFHLNHGDSLWPVNGGFAEKIPRKKRLCFDLRRFFRPCAPLEFSGKS